MRRIRARLIGAFLLIALLPALPLSCVVRDLLERSFARPRGEVVRGALEAALEDSRARLRDAKAAFEDEVLRDWSARIANGRGGADSAGADRVARGKTGAGGADSSGTIVRMLRADAVGASDPDPDAALTAEERALARWARGGAAADARALGAILSGPERVGGHLAAAIAAPGGARVLVARRLPPDMVAHAEQIAEAVSLERTLSQERAAILRSYVVPFVLLYAVLFLAAAGAGALVASRISRPIEALAAGARRVAAGDLSTRVSAPAPGEVADLVLAFNQMVERLAHQRREIERLAKSAAWRDVARTLAHEIKNPLTPIQLAVEELRDRYKGTDPEYGRLLGECATIVSEEVEALRRLVREFSEFARLPAPARSWVDAREMVAEIARLYGPERVAYEPGDAPIRARLDDEEIRRALKNLVDNGLAACHVAGRPERVAIALSRAGDEVRIEVADNGCGIAPSNIEKIFEPGFTTKSGGMGLGLAIVEGIVRGHGGSIEVESRLGQGARFAIRLPPAGPHGEES